jgi:hypothetical protein
VTVGIRLRLAAAWTPETTLLRELDRVDELTVRGLDGLLAQHAPGALEGIKGEDAPPDGPGLAPRRAAMAQAHTARVEALIDAVGRDKAIELGRAAMREVGVRLGEDARARLGVGGSVDDLVRAARVMYRILGIDFRVERTSPDRAVLRVSRCALSRWYSNDACLVMSAADEGVVRGLNPGVGMTFSRRITCGAPECEAEIVVGPLANGPADTAPAATEVGS